MALTRQGDSLFPVEAERVHSPGGEETASRTTCDWSLLGEHLVEMGPLLALAPTEWVARVDRIAPRHAASGALWLLPLLCADRMSAACALDSYGPQERLCFFDALQRPLAQLVLLPDSNYLAWDRMLLDLPPAAELHPPAMFARRLRPGHRAPAGGWSARALRFDQAADAPRALKVSLVTHLSASAIDLARRVAREEGVCVERYTTACCGEQTLFARSRPFH